MSRAGIRSPVAPATSSNGHAGFLQRKCACGSAASGITGECEGCQLRRGFGLQPKLAIGADDDPSEREADRAAAQVLRMPASPGLSADPIPPIRRRASRAAAPRPASAPTRVDAVLRAPGEALPQTARAFFEPRFGHDFGRVRVHRDAPAAASARALAAHAYTLGEHVVFAAGRYAPESAAGRQLIAHELAHVLQQRALPAAVLRRAGDPSAEAEAAAPPGEEVSPDTIALEVTADPESTEHNVHFSLDPAGGEIDFGTVYAGDVLLIRRFDPNMDALTDEVAWTLPAELERLEPAAKGALQVRVAATAASGQVVSIGLVDAGGAEYRLKLTIGGLPAGPQAVDPEFARLRGERRALRAERRAERQAFRAERRAARKAARAQRRAARAERRAERRELRQRARALRGEQRALRRAQLCGEDVQIRVQAALESAIARTGAALARLRGAEALSDSALRSALSRYMNWQPGATDSPDTGRHLARIVDTLVVAQNSMTLARHADFDCTSACDETTGAQVSEGSRKTGPSDSGVEICPAWTRGVGLHFSVTSGLEEARAYALLHEFVHKSGAFAEEKDRFYVGRDDWPELDAQATLGYADGYAALAWTLGAGGEGAP